MAPRPTPEDLKHKDQLVEASAVLRHHDRPDLAAAVDRVLSPEGAFMLARLSLESFPKSSTPVHMQKAVREHIKAAAAQAKHDLGAVAEEGLRAFIDGTWRPANPGHAGWGKAGERKALKGERVMLNLTLDTELRARADALGEELKTFLGWRPHVATLVRLWLLEKYPLPEDLAEQEVYVPARKQEKRPNLQISVLPGVRQHLQDSVRADGLELADLAEEGLRAFIDGTWRPAEMARNYTRPGKVTLNLRPDPELRARAEEVAASVPGVPGVSPLVLTWLLEKYPLPEGAGVEQ